LSPKPQKRRRGVVDTSVLAAGVAGFKAGVELTNDSASFLRDWVEDDTFTWLMTADILEEYTAVLAALRVRPVLIGRIVNLLREEAEWFEPRRTVDADPDPGDSPFWTCAEAAEADFVVTLNQRDFPQAKLKARVIKPGEPLPPPRPGKRPARAAARRRSPRGVGPRSRRRQ
jgi:predicted nucleic acid-binding protein